MTRGLPVTEAAQLARAEARWLDQARLRLRSVAVRRRVLRAEARR